jgi:hypothetical protein
MSNFAFLPPAFKDLAEASRKAEERRRRRQTENTACQSEKDDYFSD